MRWALRVRGWRGAHPSPHTSRTAQAAHSTARPRVTRAVQAAQMAQAGVTRGMGSAMAGLEALFAPAIPAARTSGMNSIGMSGTIGRVSVADGSLGSSVALQLPAALVRETTRAARLSGRRPEDVLTEALSDWLAGYSGAAGAAGAAAMAPSPLHAPGRRHSWGEIEETLRALRAS
jgi:hypothetical protein